MTGRVRRKVLIRTRPLSQGNYGGILQAYAMQRVLVQLGLEPITDLSRGDEARISGARGTLTSLIKHLAVKSGRLGIARRSWVAEALREERDIALRAFVANRIKSAILYDSAGEINVGLLDNMDLFLVGSDQVWRSAYGRVPTYLFDFVPAEDQRPRIAYAGSFGTDDLSEYTPELLRTTRELAQCFRAISVREASGVDICSSQWGMPATHVLDPTMLLTADDYAELTVSTSFESGSGFVSYVLDQAPQVDVLVQRVALHFGSSLRPLLPPDPPNLTAYRRSPKTYSRPSVEQWVAAIAGADFLITDSFHGTVFAILHSIPFVTVANRERGAARFQSLLELFGLEDRLQEPGQVVSTRLLDHAPDWDRVEAKLVAERTKSFDFLRYALDLQPGL